MNATLTLARMVEIVLTNPTHILVPVHLATQEKTVNLVGILAK